MARLLPALIHRLGEICDRTYGNQQHRASGLNLLVTTIILRNTRYLDRAIMFERMTDEVSENHDDEDWPLRIVPDSDLWRPEFALCPLILQRWAVRYFRPYCQRAR